MQVGGFLAAVILSCPHALPVAVADLPEFADAKITSREWEDLRATVGALPDADCQVDPDNALCVCSSRERKTVWVFTLTTNPAHPAVVERKVVGVGDRVQVLSRGYFAGSEAAFAEWFAGFAVMDP